MAIQVTEFVNAPKENVWTAITEMETADKRIEGILKVEVLERPSRGVIGLKWKEKRVMFGKEAEETMWITAAEEGTWYETRAENCGCVYKTKVAIKELDSGVNLSMVFESEPQTFVAKLMSPLMLLFAGTLKKALKKDLEDIKRSLES